MEMKVFKMNDCDWVCAESEEQAREYYKREFGFNDDEINNDFEGEVSIDDTMFISVEELPIDEQKQRQEMVIKGKARFVSKTFAWVIKNNKITKPCVISTTEY